MNKIKSLLVAAAAALSATASANAEWFLTGSSKIDGMLNVDGKDGQSVPLRAQVLLEERYRDPSGRIIGRSRWVPRPGLPLQFFVNPSTGTQVIPSGSYAHTDQGGWVHITWTIPRANHYRVITERAYFPGVPIGGELIRGANGFASIYVQ